MDRRRLMAAMGGALAAGVWSKALAEGDAFTLVSIYLYLPDQTMMERGPTSAALTAYVKALVAKAKATVAAAPAQAGIVGSVVVGLKPPGRSRVWVVTSDKTVQHGLATLLKAPLEAVPAPMVTGLSAFALNFSAWGGGHGVIASVPLPDEWNLALRSQGGGTLPDDALKAVWPD